MRPDTTLVRQLRLRGRTAGEVARVRRHLEGAAWPAAPGEEWIFIRRVSCRGGRGPVVPRVFAELEARLRGGAASEVVRFASLTELLAALLLDLATGRAAERWYWRRWARLFRLPAAEALAQVLEEHVEEVASVCARLARQEALPTVWLALDHPAARRVLRALAFRLGVPSAAPTGASPDGPEAEAGGELRLPAAVLRRWSPLVRRLPPADPRRQLAVWIAAAEVAPLALRGAPARLVGAVAARLDGEAPGRPPEDPVPAEEAWELPARRRPRPAPSPVLEVGPVVGRADRVPAPATPPLVERPLAAPPASTGAAGGVPEGEESPRPFAPAGAGVHGGPEAPRPRSDDRLVAADAGPVDRAPPGPAAILVKAAPILDEGLDRFRTRQGGLLYLLNLLNRPEALRLMEASWRELPSGWGWLYRLGLELALDPSDPIVSFLARQLGLDSPAQLEAVPPLPAREALLALGQRWYGRAGLWHPDLLALEAQVRASPSHVDLHAPLASVRLPVRLSGLDVDPGWLPWLGRVVTFHYERGD